MRVKKNLIRIILISVVLIAMVSLLNVSFGADGGDIKLPDCVATATINAISGFLLIGIQLFAEFVFMALHAITALITGTAGDAALSISDVVFNKCSLTSANFFPAVWIGSGGESTITNITERIQTFYVIIRNLSIALLLGILIYIGIRMAISTTGNDKAKYQKMFGNWVVSLLLVFVLHYIMILTFFANNTLVYTLSKVNESIFKSANLANSEASMYAKLMANSLVPGAGIPDLIVYGSLVIGNLAFTLMYLKRTIVLAFLIVIAPLITITYSIDKIGDGKSQALNSWLKEFIFTVIIQPFHCVIYIVFFNSAIDALVGERFNVKYGSVYICNSKYILYAKS